MGRIIDPSRARGFACALSCIVFACDDDGEAEPVDCELTIEEWCEQDEACDDLETFDDALTIAIDGRCR